MQREKTTRFFCATLWLLCTLASLARVSLGAPAQEKPSNALTELPPGVPPAVLKEIEDAFRKGSTMKNILEMLQSSGDDVDLHALSRAIVSHILSSANSGSTETALHGDGTMPNALQEDLFLAAMQGGSSAMEGLGGLVDEVISEMEVTAAPRTTRAERQTTSMTAGSTQGSATLPAIPGTSASLRESDATAATIRWLDASKRVDSVTSTPMPQGESESEKVTGSPMSPNASLIVAGDGEVIPQEAEAVEETSRPDTSTEPVAENGSTTTEAQEESTAHPVIVESESSEPSTSKYGGVPDIETSLSTDHDKKQDSEDAETFEQQDQESVVTVQPVPELVEDSDDVTTERDIRYKEQIPYGQDEADFFTGVPFVPGVYGSMTVTTIAPVFDEELDEHTVKNSENETTDPTLHIVEESEPEVSAKEPQETVTESSHASDATVSISATKNSQKTQASEFGDVKIEESTQTKTTSPSHSTTGSPAAPATSATESSVAADEASTATQPSLSSTGQDSAFVPADNSSAVLSNNRSSTFTLGDEYGSAPAIDPFDAPDYEPELVADASGTSIFDQPPTTSTPPDVQLGTHGAVEAISHFQDPVRSLIIKRLGTEFSRLTKLFRRLDLTDPLSEISTIVSEALASVRVQHLRSPAKRDASVDRDSLQLSVNGVRVDVNVTRKPEFVQRGPTIADHVSVDRRRMYVQLHLHFRNVSVPLNYSIGADLFPPFFSIRRPSGEAHVDIGEVLMPLRIPFKLLFQKTEGDTSAAGVLAPEDFVIHGASMLNVTTHLADCGERDFMEKEVLRFDERLKSGLELWLSHGPLTALTDTLRNHLLVASRHPTTMGLSGGSNSISTLINAGGPLVDSTAGTSLDEPPAESSAKEEEPFNELDVLGYGK